MKVIPIPATTDPDFSIAHSLGRVPLAAVPVSFADGTFRLQPDLYDDTDVFLSCSSTGLTGVLLVF